MLDPNGLYSDAKCNGMSVMLYTNDNRWVNLPCKKNEMCASEGDRVMCRRKGGKTSTVTLTITDGPAPTSTPSKPGGGQGRSTQDLRVAYHGMPLTQQQINELLQPESPRKNVTVPGHTANSGNDTSGQSGINSSMNGQNSTDMSSASQNNTDMSSAGQNNASQSNTGMNGQGPNGPNEQPQNSQPQNSHSQGEQPKQNAESNPSVGPAGAKVAGSFNALAWPISKMDGAPRDLGKGLGSSTHLKSEPGAAPGGSAGGKLSMDSLKKAVQACGYPTGFKENFAKELVDQINKKNWDSNQQAMFLAHVFHESAGLTKLVEEACVKSPCTQYNGAGTGGVSGAPGKNYFGRGYLQLSWPANYKEASQALYGNDQLFKDPDRVASNPKDAAGTSIWFWEKKVMSNKEATSKFGLTTKAINGALECGKGKTPTATKRWENYQKIAKALNVTKLASESGCYN